MKVTTNSKIQSFMNTKKQKYKEKFVITVNSGLPNGSKQCNLLGCCCHGYRPPVVFCFFQDMERSTTYSKSSLHCQNQSLELNSITFRMVAQTYNYTQLL